MDSEHVRIRRKPFRLLVKRFPKHKRCMAWAFWHECLMRSAWEPTENTDTRDRLILERGQFPLGRDEIADILGVSPQNIRTLIGDFNRLSELTIRSTNRGTVATIVNYDTYIYTNEEINHQINQELTSNQPATNHYKGSKGSKDSEYKVLKHMSDKPSLSDVSASKDSLSSVSSDNGNPKGKDLGIVVDAYNECIHTARLTPKSSKKILTRLGTYTPDQLREAMQRFRDYRDRDGAAWWMETNSGRGMAWFFDTDDRIEMFLNLVPRAQDATKTPLMCPEHGPMSRTNVNGKVVYFCKFFPQTCKNVYRSEAIWTDQIQKWEVKLL